MTAEKILNLHRIDIFTAADDDILLPVNQIDKPILIHLCHVPGIEPVSVKNLVGSFGIVVIAFHYPRSLNCQLAHLAPGGLTAVLTYDPCLPAISRHTDGTYLMYIFHSEMHASRTDGFTEAIVGVVLVIWKISFPSADQALGHRLRPDMHQTPLLQIIVFLL